MRRITPRLPLLGLLLVLAVTACTVPGSEAGAGCFADGPSVPLSEELDESSGAAWSLRHDGVIWSHNDGLATTLYAVDTTGATLARIPLELPPEAWDAEDLSVGPCGDGSEGCLYLADVGDNHRIRDTISVYRFREPALDASSIPVEAFHMRLPDGPLDIETLLVGPRGEVHLLSKGNQEPATLLRYPGALRADTLVTLEEVHRLGSRGRPLPDQFTGGARIPGTSLYVLRTYASLAVWRIENGTLLQVEGSQLQLGPLREAQGEAVAVRQDGRVVLTSEAGPLGRVGGMNFLRCEGLGG